MAPSLETNNNGEAKHLKQEVGHVQQEEDAIVFALNMISSVVFPLAVRSAVELGIFDILAKAGELGVKLSAEDIAVKVGSHNPEAPTMLDRLLRLLTSHSMLHCSLSKDQQQGLASPQRLYALAPASKYFVTDADGVSLGPTLNLPLDKVFLESWLVSIVFHDDEKEILHGLKPEIVIFTWTKNLLKFIIYIFLLMNKILW